MFTRVSLDIWNTVLKSNPDYREAFNKLSADTLNRRHVNVKAIQFKSHYEQTKKQVDYMERSTGLTVRREHRWHILGYNLGLVPSKIDDIFNSDYFDKVEDLFKEFPPLFMFDDTLEVINKLSQDYYLELVSNSGFLPTNLIENVIISIDQQDLSFLHSNDQLYCKPSVEFYKKTVSFPFHKEWLHVGNDFGMDVHPVKKLKGSAFLLRNQDDWNNLKNLL